MSAGQYTCTQRAEIELRADEIWDNPQMKNDYIADVAPLTAVVENQTVTLAELTDSDKDDTIKLYWVEDCDTVVQDCSDECNPGGTEVGTRCETHELDLCKEINFTIEEKQFRSQKITLEETIAKALMRRTKNLDESLATQMVLKLDSFKGVNQLTGSKGTVSGFKTEIPAAYWGADLFSYFIMAARKNRFSSPYMLNGSNLFEAYWRAKMNSANADGKGADNMFSALKMYFDLFTMDTVLSPEKASFLVDSNAVAFVTKAYYPWEGGSSMSDKWGGVGSSVGAKYSIASRNIPGVRYDVIQKIVCLNNKTYHHFNVRYHAGIFRNPVPCNPNITGVLKFLCV